MNNREKSLYRSGIWAGFGISVCILTFILVGALLLLMFTGILA